MDSKRPCEPFPEGAGNFFFARELGSGLWPALQHQGSLPGRDHFSSWDKDQLDTLASQWRQVGPLSPGTGSGGRPFSLLQCPLPVKCRGGPELQMQLSR